MQHGAAPDQRLVAGIQEAHRHELDAELFERLDALAVRHGRAVDAHHQRHVGAIDIGVHEAGLVAQARQAHRQVDGHRGLPHAAFAGADSDQVLHTWNGHLGHLARLVGGHRLLS